VKKKCEGLLGSLSVTAYPRVERFDSASIILPVLNETSSLTRTVDIVLRAAKDHVGEVLIVVCGKTTPAARATVERLRSELPDLVVVIDQELPLLGGALRAAIAVARGSHVVMMASDLETNPSDVKLLIGEAHTMPWGIVTASRWRSGGAFHGYSRIKLVCNWIFQRGLSLLYWTKLTDMTYGFRILPTKLAQAIAWEEVGHPFNLESIVKPLRLGVPVVEIPSVWCPRMEGASSNPFFRNFAYFRIGLKTRFAHKKALLKPSPLQPGEPGRLVSCRPS
jgi:glycosyltransferase involved in cell wall biosynthesis